MGIGQNENMKSSFLSYDLKVGYSCNNRCKHCVIAGNKVHKIECNESIDLSFEEIKSLIEENCRDNVNRIVLTGGEVTIRLRVIKSGVRISLTDHWQNPFDETIKSKSYISFEITKDYAPDNIWTDIVVKYNEQRAEVFADKKLINSIKINKKMPHGLSYLHIQTLAENEDFEGTCIKYLTKK